MGYTTEFTGVLEFVNELTIEQLKMIESFFDGAEVDDHPEWVYCPGEKPYYIQFEVTPDYKGIRWDGGEKFYDSVEAVNCIIATMRSKWPDFGLRGELLAQGEDYDDRWILRMVDGRAVRIDQPLMGQKVKCPHCDECFILESTEEES